MLYDPKWEAGSKAITQPDPFTLQSLIAWLEKQPATGKYDYCDPDNCVLCQYFTAMGFRKVRVAFNELETGRVSRTFPMELKVAAQGSGWGWTFGAALKRARNLAAS